MSGPSHSRVALCLLLVLCASQALLSAQVSELVVNASATVELECDAEDTTSATWTVDSKPIALADPRFTVFDNGNLTIQNCTPLDAGAYSCVAESAKPNAKQPQVTQLHVHGPPVLWVNPRKKNGAATVEEVAEGWQTREVWPGADLELSCEVRGWPSPRVTWQVDGQLEPTWNLQVVTVPGVRKAANYTCVAKNENGDIQFTTIVTLKDTTPNYAVIAILVILGVIVLCIALIPFRGKFFRKTMSVT